jgi:hypothetical protein
MMTGILPFEFVSILKYIKSLDPEDEPNYAYIKSMVKKSIPQNDFTRSEPEAQKTLLWRG